MSAFAAELVNGFEEDSPVRKLTAALRKFKEWPLGVTIPQTQLTKVAALVFTGRSGEVTGRLQNGQCQRAPLNLGEVIVAKTRQLPSQLVQHMHQQQIRPLPGQPGPITEAQIMVIARTIAEAAQRGADTAIRIGDILVDPVPLEENAYYSLHDARLEGKERRFRVKRFHMKPLTRGDTVISAQSLAREWAVLKNELPRDSRLEDIRQEPHVDGGDVYVVLERVDAPTLEEWLDTDPSRSDRLRFLRELADIAGLLSQNNVVHRNLTPQTVLVRDGKPFLTSFQLARIHDAVTLLMDARQLLDQQYQPPETFNGGVLGAATDAYAVGVIALKVLTGEVPFETFQQLNMRRSKPGFWENISLQAGLSEEALLDLKRLLSRDPAARPVGQELVNAIGRWS